MGLLDLQSLEWTPSACFIAVQGSMVVVTALQLIFGSTDGIYKFEPHTKEIASRPYELILGGCLLGWGLGMVGALAAGGAKIMCILQLIPMLTATYYHYVSKGKTNVVVNAVFMVAAAACGFIPLPEVPAMHFYSIARAWTAPAIFMTVFSLMITIVAILFLTGKVDGIYANEPHTKNIMTRRGELQIGSCLLGWGLAMWAATIAGGARDMCFLYVAGVIPCTIYHYQQGGTKNAVANCVFMALALFMALADIYGLF